jgi:multiple sugar transport system substrate-binding protein
MRKSMWMATVLMLVALLIAACGGTTGTGGTGGDTAAPTEAPATEGDTGTETGDDTGTADETDLTLLGWASSQSEDTRLNEVVGNFNTSNEQFNATFNPVPEYDAALQTALAGTPPDLFYVNADAFPNLASQGALAVVGDAVENPDDFYQPMLQAFTYDGQLMGVPKDFSVLALIYNEAMVEEAGVAVPTTWDEFRSSLQTLVDAGQPPACIDSTIDRWGVFALQAGGNFLSEDRQTAMFNSDPMKQGLTFYTDLVADGLAFPPGQLDSGWCGEALGTGRASMTIEGNWIVPFLGDSFPDIQWGAAPLPAGPAGQGTWAFTAAYGFSPKSANPDGSRALLGYLTGPDGMKEWTDLGLAMPTRQSLAAGFSEQFPNLTPFVESAEFATVRPSAVGFPAVIDELKSQVESVISGNQTVDGALDAVQTAAEGVLAQ